MVVVPLLFSSLDLIIQHFSNFFFFQSFLFLVALSFCGIRDPGIGAVPIIET